jgi:hypothetical protein
MKQATNFPRRLSAHCFYVPEGCQDEAHHQGEQEIVRKIKTIGHEQRRSFAILHPSSRRHPPRLAMIGNRNRYLAISVCSDPFADSAKRRHVRSCGVFSYNGVFCTSVSNQTNVFVNTLLAAY